MGKMLWVDLTHRNLQEEALDEKLCRDFIGGYGLGARLLFSRMKPGADPMGPDNVLGFVTGPLTGTPALGGSRYVVVTKSPLTGGWGDANSGGYFGPHLKFAGYDAVFFTGISAKPVLLVIDSGKAELRDAAYLWGKDAAEVDDVLRAEFGKESESCCIGPSGEKLALIAAVINNKGRAAGRSGVGAVMGSKRLKAIVVKGNARVPLADAALAGELRKKYLSALTGNATAMRQFGTPFLLMPCATKGDSPIKNWAGLQAVDFPTVENIDANHVIALQEKRYACYMCPLGCGGHMKAGTEYKYAAGAHKPEYESLGMFGTNLLIDNLEAIIMANDICNRYGLDTISAGACLGFAMECYEKGILTKKDTDGIELTWGNHRAMVDMLEKLARREGFGNILADGVKVAAEKIGRGSEKFAMHIQGEEIPAHDPKFNLNWAVGYRLDPTPARHTQGMGVSHTGSGLPLPPFDPKSQYGRAPSHKIRHSYSHCIQAAGLCAPVAGSYPGAGTFVDFMNAVTGWGFTLDEFLKIGERITNIRQAFNVREGLNSSRFAVPDRITGIPPQKEGPLAGITLDFPAIAREYYTEMDWDPQTSKPNRKKLTELGMQDVAVAIWG